MQSVVDEPRLAGQMYAPTLTVVRVSSSAGLLTLLGRLVGVMVFELRCREMPFDRRCAVAEDAGEVFIVDWRWRQAQAQ